MKILFRQTDNNLEASSLSKIEISSCMFKHLTLGKDAKFITKRIHCHTGYELHIIKDGRQLYEVDGKEYVLEGGNFLLIPPNVPHKTTEAKFSSEKFSLMFNWGSLQKGFSCCFGKVSDRVFYNIDYIVQEFYRKKQLSPLLIENAIVEILIAIFRQCGFNEKVLFTKSDENSTLILAKQYILDNIDLALSVQDVAGYCYLSAKQITRLFTNFENITPGEFIRKERVKRIEQLILEDKYTLKQISDKMHFSNEHYFNLFFKQNYGMPPGEYKRMTVENV